MNKERVLITVKTYPTLSRKYGETVCTAGIREDGTWVRIYPVPFRRLDEAEQYSKFDWLECRLARNPSDPRPETFRPVDEGELQPVDHIGTASNWRERRRIVLKTARVYDRLDELIAGAKANQMSLAVFKPLALGLLARQIARVPSPAAVVPIAAKGRLDHAAPAISFGQDALALKAAAFPAGLRLPVQYTRRLGPAHCADPPWG
jgi:hypothetical protein